MSYSAGNVPCLEIELEHVGKEANVFSLTLSEAGSSADLELVK